VGLDLPLGMPTKFGLDHADMIVAVAELVLFALFLGAMATCMWANTRMMRRARKAGYRYWLINPMSTLAALRGAEPVIFVVALLVGCASVMARSH
jgi:hypothetical protein